ncbi:MAG: RsmB/NOP family class I SAM-dependent RNA methyltransferase [Clostridia bacterium]|nr:RsmB/NOP family class I SAM-dependent RNA methyltransferase [Clostridia bacterium]
MDINNEDFLNQKLHEQYGDDDINRIYEGLKCKRVVTLRVNTLKSDRERVLEVFKNEGIEYENVKWSDIAFIIKNRTESELEELDIYKNGEIYLQSLSSMLPPVILMPQDNEDILDMAAAPGGKTTQIAAITDNQAHITACEMNNIRAEKLRYNIEKQGASSVYVMQKDSRNIDEYFSFDRILLDAPCSGSGTLDLNLDNAFKYFSPKLVEKSTKAQSSLLKKAVQILKPGKEMVYSTCSILACENEDVVSQVLKSGKVELVPIDFDGMSELPLLATKLEGTLCVCPNELYEGFFIAKLRKKA